MPVTLNKGYLVFGFFLVSDDPAKWMPNIYELIKEYCKKSSLVSEIRTSPNSLAGSTGSFPLSAQVEKLGWNGILQHSKPN